MDLLVIAYIQEAQRRDQLVARRHQPERSTRRVGRIRRRPVA
ncbi:MAG TPA: hypothetical protein VFP06_00770 [Acidimicrobiales bacterium]|nr:hypothetical protein [Acidimicrobiales bacterium]